MKITCPACEGADGTLIGEVYRCDGCGEELRNYTMPEVKRLREALTEITKGEGRYSRDPLIHAANTIDNMVEIAQRALKGGGE